MEGKLALDRFWEGLGERSSGLLMGMGCFFLRDGRDERAGIRCNGNG